jgi:hypothetical protein
MNFYLTDNATVLSLYNIIFSGGLKRMSIDKQKYGMKLLERSFGNKWEVEVRILSGAHIILSE